MENIDSLREDLEKVRQRIVLAMADEDFDVLDSLFSQEKSIERAIGFAEKKPVAILIDGHWDALWDVGASMPQIMYNHTDDSLVLTYNGRFLDHKVRVLFKKCFAFRFSKMLNDFYSFEKHYLYERGLERFSAHMVVNSPWIEEEKAKNDDKWSSFRWSNLQHYLLIFKDEYLECISESYIFL